MSAECNVCGTDLVYGGEEAMGMYCQVCELRKERDALVRDRDDLYEKTASEIDRRKAQRDEARKAHGVLWEERDALKLRVTRLRKAVNWLRGACHDESIKSSQAHHFNVEMCSGWECQRAKAVLDEEAE
jgi:hypothetical protein